MKGGGGKKEQEARCDLLEKLKLGSPALPLAMEVNWRTLRDAWAKHMAQTHKEKVGQIMIETVNRVLKSLGQHYKHQAKNKAKPVGGSPKAFERFFRELEEALPKASSSISL